MRDAEEKPLGVDFDFSSQTESIQSQGASYICKDGFDEPHPLAVDLSPCVCVDLFDHFLCVALFCSFGFSGKKGDLSCLGMGYP